MHRGRKIRCGEDAALGQCERARRNIHVAVHAQLGAPAALAGHVASAQVVPSPVNPALQSQSKLPSVSWQTALVSQLCVAVAHSSTLTQDPVHALVATSQPRAPAYPVAQAQIGRRFSELSRD